MIGQKRKRQTKEDIVMSVADQLAEKDAKIEALLTEVAFFKQDQRLVDNTSATRRQMSAMKIGSQDASMTTSMPAPVSLRRPAQPISQPNLITTQPGHLNDPSFYEEGWDAHH